MPFCTDLDSFNSLENEGFESGKLLFSFNIQHNTEHMVQTQ